VLDAQWIQRLHAYGLLRPSFRPPDSVLALRGYHRQRQIQIRYAAGHTQHMQKALEQMNVKLTEVVSNITGLTGRRIIAAILDGERDPQAMAALRDPKCKSDHDTIARALEGTWRPEHLFALRQARDLYEFHHRQIAECDAMIQAELARLPDRSGRAPAAAPRPRGPAPRRRAGRPRWDGAAREPRPVPLLGGALGAVLRPQGHPLAAPAGRGAGARRRHLPANGPRPSRRGRTRPRPAARVGAAAAQ
jgi:transposase